MSAQKGKDLLLKVDFNQTGTFQTVAGMRSRRIAFNAETVDITNADSIGRWRELLEGAGMRRAGLAGHLLINLRHTATETTRGDATSGRRALARFRAVTEPLSS